MSYEHCDKHNVDATNGCPECETEARVRSAFEQPPPEPVAIDNEGLRQEPPPELVIAMQLHFARKREELLRQVQQMEDFLGFIEVSGELATRIAKLEAFLGIKG